MEKLTHPLARGASWLLIYLTAVQPLHPAVAAGISAANGNTQVVVKTGNVPVVNIANPTQQVYRITPTRILMLEHKAPY